MYQYLYCMCHFFRLCRNGGRIRRMDTMILNKYLFLKNISKIIVPTYSLLETSMNKIEAAY